MKGRTGQSSGVLCCHLQDAGNFFDSSGRTVVVIVNSVSNHDIVIVRAILQSKSKGLILARKNQR
jgi:hypothetical protein